MRDQIEKFSRKTVYLHWLIALAMVGMLAFGIYIHEAIPLKLPSGEFNPEKFYLIGIHKSIGVGILFFALWRVVWRFMNGWPKPAGNYKRIETILSKITHYLLIIGTLAMPITGLIMSQAYGKPVSFFSLFNLPVLVDKNADLEHLFHTLHAVSAKILIGAIILHVVGALKHHFVDKDGTLKRMAGKRIAPPDQNIG